MEAKRHCPPLLTLFQSIMETERKPRLENQNRMRALVRDHGDEVEIFSAHDPAELARYQPSS
jgi:hypothetical protein